MQNIFNEHIFNEQAQFQTQSVTIHMFRCPCENCGITMGKLWDPYFNVVGNLLLKVTAGVNNTLFQTHKVIANKSQIIS